MTNQPHLSESINIDTAKDAKNSLKSWFKSKVSEFHYKNLRLQDINAYALGKLLI